MKVVDLFCGAGGFSLGFEKAGHDVVYAIDNNESAIKTYKNNLNTKKVICDDIKNIEKVPEADIVIGGPPCPEFSNANRNKNPEKGLELVNEFLRIKDMVNPSYWVMENVPNIKKHLKRKKFPTQYLLNCADFGVPQKRVRFFGGKFNKPKNTHNEKRQMTINGEKLEEWKTVKNTIKDLFGKTDEKMDHIPEFGATLVEYFSKENKYNSQRQIDINKPAPTIKAQEIARNKKFPHYFIARRMNKTKEIIEDINSVDDVQDIKIRRLTIRECARLQTFPDWFEFYGSKTDKYKQIGNAVPPTMSFKLAESMC